MFDIPLTKPFIPESAKEKVLEVLESGFLTEGRITRAFEEKVKDYVGCQYAVAATSCTTGLELALRAAGIGEGDDVIVPDYTYPATALSVMITGARPVIVDIDSKTMLIDYGKAEAAITEKTKALMPVSEFGNPLDYDRLNAIKDKYGILIIEDAACALGSEFKRVKTGNLADISVFSFHPRKFITCGEGGMITTNNSQWADFMNSYKHFGMRTDNGKFFPEFVTRGSNYKLSDILAAVGLEQMNIVDELLEERIKSAETYKELLTGVKGVAIPEITGNGKHSYQSFCVFVKPRDKVLNILRAKGIEAQIGTYSLHRHKAFEVEYDFPGSDFAYEHALALPFFYGISTEEQRRVIKELAESCAE